MRFAGSAYCVFLYVLAQIIMQMNAKRLVLKSASECATAVKAIFFIVIAEVAYWGYRQGPSK